MLPITNTESPTQKYGPSSVSTTTVICPGQCPNDSYTLTPGAISTSPFTVSNLSYTPG